MTSQVSSSEFCVICHPAINTEFCSSSKSNYVPSEEEASLLQALCQGLDVDLHFNCNLNSNFGQQEDDNGNEGEEGVVVVVENQPDSLQIQDELNNSQSFWSKLLSSYVSSWDSCFCGKCKETVNKLRLIIQQIELLQTEKSRLTQQIVTNIILSSSQNQSQSDVTSQSQLGDENVEPKTNSPAKFSNGTNVNNRLNFVPERHNQINNLNLSSTHRKVLKLRQEIHSRFSPTVILNNLKFMPPGNRKNLLNSSKKARGKLKIKVETLNYPEASISSSPEHLYTPCDDNLSHYSDDNLDSNSPNNLPNVVRTSMRAKKLSSRYKQYKNRENSNSNNKLKISNNKLSQNKKPMKITKKPISKHKSVKNKNRAKPKTSTTTCSRSSAKREKDRLIERLGEGKYMYRGHLPYEFESGSSKYLCGICPHYSKRKPGILEHLRRHDPPGKPRKKRKLNSVDKNTTTSTYVKPEKMEENYESNVFPNSELNPNPNSSQVQPPPPPIKRRRKRRSDPPETEEQRLRRLEEEKEKNREKNYQHKLNALARLSGSYAPFSSKPPGYEFVVKAVGEGQYTYRGHLPFESIQGTNGFKCGLCSYFTKGYNAILYHLRRHASSNNSKSNVEEDVNPNSSPVTVRVPVLEEGQNGGQNERIQEKEEIIEKEKTEQKSSSRKKTNRLVTLDCGDGTFLTDLKWKFRKLEPPPELPECSDLNDGLKDPSTKLDQYQCDACGRITKGRPLMVNHIRDFHVAPIILTCPICSRVFNVKVNFENHLATHSSEKKFVCHICGFAVKYKYYLKIHLKGHQGQFKCPKENCGKVFAAGCSLRRHLENHDGQLTHMCEECGARFAKKANLTIHIQAVHEKKIKHVCPHDGCGKGFFWHTHLRRHLLVHSKKQAAIINS